MTLFERVQAAPNAFDQFKTEQGYTACLHPEPFEGDGAVLVWFFCRATKCQVFVGVSKTVAEQILENSWADVSHEFCVFVEWEVMEHCKENTDWHCDCEAQEDGNVDVDRCSCAPFESADFTYGIAEAYEFVLPTQLEGND